MAAGTLFIVSAPSGAGKTSLVRALVAATEHLTVSISHTTRPIRPGETDGRDYHFVTPELFERKVREGEFLEFARVFDNAYGTSRLTVEDHLSKGVDVILEIDWQGARQVREKMPESVSVFVLPPTLDALRERLEGRAQDDEAVIARRMADARSEMSHYPEFDFLVINDRFDVALKDLEAIVRARRLRLESQRGRCRDTLEALLR